MFSGGGDAASSSALYTALSRGLPLIPLAQRLRNTWLQQSWIFAYLGLALYVAQLLGFVFNPHIPWSPIISGGFDTMLFATHVPIHDGVFAGSTSQIVFHVFLWLAVGLLAVTWFIAALVADRGGGDEPVTADGSSTAKPTVADSAATLFTGSVMRATSTWLVAPFVQWASAAWACKDDVVTTTEDYSDSSATVCYSGEHIAYIIGGILLVFLAMPIVYVTTVVDADTRLTSSHPRARAHTYLDLVFVLQMAILSALLRVAIDHQALAVIAAAVFVICAVVAVLVAAVLPFFDHTVNRVLVGGNTAAAAVGAVAFFASWDDGAVHFGRLPSTIALAALLPAFVFGWLAADIRLSSRWRQLITLCDESLEAEEDDYDGRVADDSAYPETRCKPTMNVLGLDDHSLWKVSEGHGPDGGGGQPFAFGHGANDDDEEEFAAEYEASETASSVASSIGNQQAREHEPEMMRQRRAEIQQLVSRSGARIKPCAPAPFVSTVYTATDVELATRFATNYKRRFALPLTDLLKNACANVFERGLARFSRSPIVPIHFAEYVATCDHQRCTSALGLLESVPGLNPGVHELVRFGDLKQQLRAALGIWDRAYEREINRASELHTEALRRLHAFWLKLMEPSVDLASAAEMADELHSVRRKALQRFRNALDAQRGNLDAEFPQRLGSFVKEVTLDHGAATECEAVAIELVKRGQVRKRNAVDAEMATRVARLSTVIGDEDGASSNAASMRNNSRKTHLLQHMTGVFAFLLLCLAALLGLSVLANDVDRSVTSRAVTANKLRTIPLEALYLTSRYRDEVTASGALTATAQSLRQRLDGLVSELEASIATTIQADATVSQFLTGSSTRSMLSSESLIMSDPSPKDPLNDASRSLHDYDAISFWSTLALTVQEFRQATLALNDTRSLEPVQRVIDHLHDHMLSTSAEGVSRSLHWWLEEHAISTAAATAILASIIAVALATTLLAIFAFVHNFNRAAETKFLTFQLFTLIPFDSLELLATATKSRIDERDASRSRAAAAADAGSLGDKEESQSDTESSSSSSGNDMFNVKPNGVPAPGDRSASSADPLRSSSDASRFSIGSDGANRRRSTRHRRVDPKSWRGMLQVQLHRNGPPKSILKMTLYGVETAEVPIKTGRGNTGPKVQINPEVDVVEAVDAGEAGAAAATLTGKGALNMLAAMQQKQTVSSAADLSASSITLAEKTGELDLEAIKAGESWRAGAGVYPTRIVGGAATLSSGLSSMDAQSDAGGDTARKLLRGIDVILRVAAVAAVALCGITFAIVFVSLMSSTNDTFKIRSVPSAAVEVSERLADTFGTMQSFVFEENNLRRVSFADALAFRGELCGTSNLVEPLMNQSIGREATDSVARVASVSGRALRVFADATRLVEYADARREDSSTVTDTRITSLKNVSVVLRRNSVATDPIIAEVDQHVNAAIQSGSTQPSVILASAIRMAARRIMSSARALQLASDSYFEVTRAASIQLEAACEKTGSLGARAVLVDVCRWTGVAAAACLVLSICCRFGYKRGRVGAAPFVVLASTLAATAAMIAFGELLHDYVLVTDTMCEAGRSSLRNSEIQSMQVLTARNAVQHGQRNAIIAFQELAPVDFTGTIWKVLRSAESSLDEFFTAELVSGLRSAAAAQRKAAQLCRIGAALVVAAIMDGPTVITSIPSLALQDDIETLPLDSETVAFAEHTDWNVAADEALTLDVSRFYAGDVTASIANRTHDLARWSNRQRHSEAVQLLHDERFRDSEHAMRTLWAEFATSLTDAIGYTGEKARRSMLAASYASLAFGIVTFVLFAVVVIPGLIRTWMGATADEKSDDKQSSAMERIRAAPSFQRALRQSYLAVSLIGALLLASLGTAMYAAQVNTRITEYMEVGGLRSLFVAQSYATMLREDGVVDDEACTLHAIDAMITAEQDLWFTLDHRLAALRVDGDYDAYSWGLSSGQAYLEYGAGYTTSQCGTRSTPAGVAPAYGPFGVLDQPLHSALRTWQTVVNEFYANTTSNVRRDSLRVQIASLADAIVTASYEADKRLQDVADNRESNTMIALQVLAATTIVLVVVLYQALVVPISRELSRVQEDTLLMLQVVPPEVRDLVPAITEYLETGTMDTAAEIRRKLEMNESLLKNILPENISRRLKSGESPIADMHQSITIVFTDFVGFTSISSGLSAEEIVDFLNEVFVEFDLITELLKLDKIKTIGDAYFMTGGLDPTITDHAMRVIEASICMFEALAEHNGRHRDRKPLRMRLGVHTGPAVAGVIGTKKVAYDLWGPNVAIANAMESTGIPGHIHVSETTVAHVRGYYAFEPRGELPKEKGVPDQMPATFLFKGRLVPTPYQFLRRPRNEPRQQQPAAPSKSKDSTDDRNTEESK